MTPNELDTLALKGMTAERKTWLPKPISLKDHIADLHDAATRFEDRAKRAEAQADKLAEALRDCLDVMERVHGLTLPVHLGAFCEEQDWSHAGTQSKSNLARIRGRAVILRDYQAQAADAILREFESVQSTLAKLPTGTGKTPLGAEVIRRMNGGSVLFLAHREELLYQARRTIEEHCGVQTETEMADRHASEMFPAPVLLASVQTMISGQRGRRRMLKFSPSNYVLVICDEGHHYVAPMFREVVNYFTDGNPDIKVLYLTATPKRADKKALHPICQSVAFDYSVLQAIKDGWLVSIQQQLIDIQGLDYSHITTVAGDFNQGQLAQVLEAERNLYGMCDATMRELGERKGLAFFVTVKQAQMATDIFNRYRSGVAVCAHGKTPKEDRRRIWRDYREGRHQLFCNVDIAGEGADIPDADLMVDFAPTKSKPRYEQRMGRIMRPLSGLVDGLQTPAARRAAISSSPKPISTVIDFTGNAGKHKLVNAIDILGGDINHRVRELAERELRKTGKPTAVEQMVMEAQQRAREELRLAEAARKAQLTARAVYTSRMIDPFDMFDIIAPSDRSFERGKTLSDKQRAILIKQKIDPDRLSYAQGKVILNECFRRWDNGLATLGQIRVLKQRGFETKDLTRDAATSLINGIATREGWRK